jgi:serine/threonine protein kinase
LLREHFSPDGPLSGPALAVERSGEPAAPTSDAATPMIGRYKLLEKIGEGGFGEVWMAEQREPVKRRVALKIIKLGMDTRQVIARFEAERQALALMDHPNIAKILDAGTTGGMEKAEGRMKKEEAAPLLTSAFHLPRWAVPTS